MTTLKKDGRKGESIQQMAQAVGAVMPHLDATGRGSQSASIACWHTVSRRLRRQLRAPSESRSLRSTNSWPGVFRSDDGRVVGSWGLAIFGLEPECRLRVDGKTYFAWCALDTLFIAALLGKSVEVEASCPVTGELVSLVVAPSEVRELSRPAPSCRW